LQDFTIFSITKLNGGTLKSDGVLGLSMSPPSDIMGGKSLVQALYDENFIDSKLVGLFFGGS